MTLETLYTIGFDATDTTYESHGIYSSSGFIARTELNAWQADDDFEAHHSVAHAQVDGKGRIPLLFRVLASYGKFLVY